MARFRGLLDACVLVPVVLADTLLRCAEHELYRPLWSEPILAEARAALERVHPDVPPATFDRRFQCMHDAFEDALVTAWEPLVDGITLPDADDRHVLAAAVRGGAQAVVTSNLKHFPADVLAPYGVEPIHPDVFLLDLLDLAPATVLTAVREQAAHTRRPPLSVADVTARLARAGVPEFADEVARRL